MGRDAQHESQRIGARFGGGPQRGSRDMGVILAEVEWNKLLVAFAVVGGMHYQHSNAYGSRVVS